MRQKAVPIPSKIVSRAKLAVRLRSSLIRDDWRFAALIGDQIVTELRGF